MQDGEKTEQSDSCCREQIEFLVIDYGVQVLDEDCDTIILLHRLALVVWPLS